MPSQNRFFKSGYIVSQNTTETTAKFAPSYILISAEGILYDQITTLKLYSSSNRYGLFRMTSRCTQKALILYELDPPLDAKGVIHFYEQRYGKSSVSFQQLRNDSGQHICDHLIIPEVPGISLSKLIKNNQLQHHNPVKLFLLVAKALKRIHDVQLVFGVITPKDVLYDKETDSCELIRTHRKMEEAISYPTTDYSLAPECYQNDSIISPSIDIYTLGQFFKLTKHFNTITLQSIQSLIYACSDESPLNRPTLDSIILQAENILLALPPSPTTLTGSFSSKAPQLEEETKPKPVPPFRFGYMHKNSQKKMTFDEAIFTPRGSCYQTPEYLGKGVYGLANALHAEGKSTPIVLIKPVSSKEHINFNEASQKQKFFKGLYGDDAAYLIRFGNDRVPSYRLVLRFIRGQTFQQLGITKKIHKIPPATLLLKAAQALQKAHDANFVVVDLNSSNILYEEESKTCFFIDGGHSIGAGSVLKLLVRSDLIKPPHIAPECWSCHPTRPDKRADIYSLGVVIKMSYQKMSLPKIVTLWIDKCQHENPFLRPTATDLINTIQNTLKTDPSLYSELANPLFTIGTLYTKETENAENQYFPIDSEGLFILPG